MENTDYLMNAPNISHPALRLLVERDPHLLLDEKGTPEIKHITEKLELELGESLKGRRVTISNIKGIKSRFVLLIGSDDYLLEAVGTYIYCLNCIKGGTDLFYYSFRGESDDCLAKILTAKYIFMNDTTIRQCTAARDIFENERLIGHGTVCKNVSSTGYPKTMDGDLLEHIRQGRSVFLSDLKYPNSLLLESIGKRIKGIVTHWETYEVDKRGLLITSAESEKDLPKYFVKQFPSEAIIDLEAGKQYFQDTATPQTTQGSEDTPAGQNVFRWNGGTWEIAFDGKTIRPPDSFGLKYIHYLLKHPDKEIYATELRLITGTQLRERSNKSYDEEKKDNEESSGIESGDKMNKILDSTSIEEIKRAIGYLSEQSVGAEEEERAELLDKKTSLELYLKKATNINADSRDFSTDLEKARKAVSKCITNSLEIIKKEHTTLEQYLSTTIKMGNVFQYKHTSKIDWQLS